MNQELRSQVGDHVVIIATWDDPNDKKITIQDFVQNGESFIPVFTSIGKAKEQTKGSGFTDKLVEIKTDLFASLLKGQEVLLFNPADAGGVKLAANDFKKVYFK